MLLSFDQRCKHIPLPLVPRQNHLLFHMLIKGHIQHNIFMKTFTFFNILFYHIHFFRNVINLKYENLRKHVKVMEKIYFFLKKYIVFRKRRDNHIFDITHLKNEILCYRISENAISCLIRKTDLAQNLAMLVTYKLHIFEVYLMIE